VSTRTITICSPHPHPVLRTLTANRDTVIRGAIFTRSGTASIARMRSPQISLRTFPPFISFFFALAELHHKGLRFTFRVIAQASGGDPSARGKPGGADVGHVAKTQRPCMFVLSLPIAALFFFFLGFSHTFH
jgi:hypothetical protein